MNDFARRAISELGQAALQGTTDAVYEIADSLYAEGAREQESVDRRTTSAMLAEAGLDEQLILWLFNRYWNTASDEGIELIRTGQQERLMRYMFDLGLRGGKAHYFLEIGNADEAFRDASFRKLKVDKQYSKLLATARHNGWDE